MPKQWGQRNGPFNVLWLLLFMISQGWTSTCVAGQEVELDKRPIVLRDLTLIRDRTITDFDDASITLSDGSKLSWDQVLQAVVEPTRQAEFDRGLERIGLPLFRMKARIQVGDWNGAGEIAESIYDRQSDPMNVSVDSDTFFLASLATMRLRLSRGDRLGALLPFLHAARLQPQIQPATRQIAGNGLIAQADLETGISHELAPVWFDSSELSTSGQTLATNLKRMIRDSSNSFGLQVYLASIEIELGQTDEALRGLQNTIPGEDAEGWTTILEARLLQKKNRALQAQSVLGSNENELSGLARLAGLYYQGINTFDLPDLSDVDHSVAILTMLRIPAVHGERNRDLAAAALYQSAQIAKLRGRERDAQKLANELLSRYPRTYHGRLETKRRLNNQR